MKIENCKLRILAIESSCDETAVAVVEGDGKSSIKVISDVIYSQIKLHRKFGGVYPEAASREHLRKIFPVLEMSIQKSNLKNQNDNSKSKINYQNFIRDEIDAIAVTAGPGLIGSLLVGMNLAKTLAYVFNKPLVGVNHVEGHIAAAWIDSSSGSTKHETRSTKHFESDSKYKVPKPPAITLVVSGGHTQLVLMKGIGDFVILGRTRDDAVGEAFDKVARLLGLGYPGGPVISALAGRYKLTANSYKLALPRPMMDSGNLDFSFSGLKTAVARQIALNQPLTTDKKIELAYEFQEAATDVLVAKTLMAIKQFKPKSFILAGGVAANLRLREKITQTITGLKPQVDLHIPAIKYCTDNAAMIGAVGLYKLLAKKDYSWYDVRADDRLQIGQKSNVKSQNDK